MATQVTKTVIDDIDGSEATETVRFTIGGRSYEIDLGAKNVAKLDNLLTPYKVRGTGGRPPAQRTRRASKKVSASRGRSSKSKSLFSGLDADQKVAFRNWASMPEARRISDVRVQAWIEAGRPASGKATARKVPARKAPAKRRVVRKRVAARKAPAKVN